MASESARPEPPTLASRGPGRPFPVRRKRSGGPAGREMALQPLLVIGGRPPYPVWSGGQWGAVTGGFGKGPGTDATGCGLEQQPVGRARQARGCSLRSQMASLEEGGRRKVSANQAHAVFPEGLPASAPQGDLLFLLDSSASVSHYEFSRVREFLGQLAAPLPLGPGALRASLVHVGSQPYAEFPFGQHSSGAVVQDAIRAAAQRMGDTNTGRALAYAKKQLFDTEAGARPGVPKVLVWVTDGGSSDPVGPPMQELKDLGVTVFIISTGRGNRLELSAAASAPPEKHLHVVDVDDMSIIAQTLRDSILGRWEEKELWGVPTGSPSRRDGARLQEDLEPPLSALSIGWMSLGGPRESPLAVKTGAPREGSRHGVTGRAWPGGGQVARVLAFHLAAVPAAPRSRSPRAGLSPPLAAVVICPAAAPSLRLYCGGAWTPGIKHPQGPRQGTYLADAARSRTQSSAPSNRTQGRC
ncbi:von Willebrand factor A domain-containing protein 1 [Echinops telfairi]|uniref:von Willebrand factor A domain-containing protein 1 n=1 Tax=Echinops telfairi TaxID=9371 RepID=A0AC55DTU5_ECHTE|nr:von Willebrand factor A domain-containing protein 1 [Echinops telfairi]